MCDLKKRRSRSCVSSKNLCNLCNLCEIKKYSLSVTGTCPPVLIGNDNDNLNLNEKDKVVVTYEELINKLQMIDPTQEREESQACLSYAERDP